MREQQAFTLLQARLVCKQYQHLAGKILLQEPTDFSRIECVAICPFDADEKRTFAYNYLNCGDPHNALEFYKGQHYDILLLARSVSDQSMMVFEELYSYLQHNSIAVAV
ncbi:MAG: hypothetical protein EOP51_06365 [Sphingobacteriales bacterium]|nr:MAG: hypothetical protein EOP51_06365 [Sphingobacteriales bacterium]